jgi:hypothetical protein
MPCALSLFILSCYLPHSCAQWTKVDQVMMFMKLLMEQSKVRGRIRRVSPTSVSDASSLSILYVLLSVRQPQVQVVAVCYESDLP